MFLGKGRFVLDQILAEPSYSVFEVCLLAGISPAALRYWVAEQLVSPMRESSGEWAFTQRDALMLWAISKLQQRFFDLERVRLLLPGLRLQLLGRSKRHLTEVVEELEKPTPKLRYAMPGVSSGTHEPRYMLE